MVLFTALKRKNRQPFYGLTVSVLVTALTGQC